MLHVDRRHIDKEVELSSVSQVRTSFKLMTVYADYSPLFTPTMRKTCCSQMRMPNALTGADQVHGYSFAAQEPVKRTVSLFGHFASQWFPAMVDAVLDAAGPPEKGGVHYLLLDCCVTWMQWPLLFPRPPEGDAAHKLLHYLVRCSALIPFQNVF